MREVSSLYENYLDELRAQFPGLKIVNKVDHRVSRLVNLALRALTFGGQSAYLTKYVTTFGQSILVPNDWHERSSVERYITMRHEAVHLRQFARYGIVGMSVIYALPFFPLGLAWGRARLEWEAYRETMLAIAEVHGIDAVDEHLRAHIASQFVGPAYAWMWPFPRTIERWFAKAREEIRLELRARSR